MHKIRNFHEGHSTVGEWQASGRGTAGERRGMCESAFKGLPSRLRPFGLQFSIIFGILLLFNLVTCLESKRWQPHQWTT
jgi:hypothetical protein